MALALSLPVSGVFCCGDYSGEILGNGRCCDIGFDGGGSCVCNCGSNGVG